MTKEEFDTLRKQLGVGNTVDATITNVLNVNYQSNLIGSDGEDYGRTFPIIIASAPTGIIAS